MRKRAFLALLPMIALGACDSPSATDTQHRRVRVTFSAATPQTSAAQERPFVSVADSVTLVVTPSAGSPIVLGKHLARRETSVSFSVSVADGPTRFQASVVSVNRTPLFVGDATVAVNGDNDAVAVTLEAVNAVLLLEPDTVSVTVSSEGTGLGKVVVRNRGNKELQYVIGSASQCGQSPCFFPTPQSGNVAAFSDSVIQLYRVQRLATPVSLKFTSKAGDVSVVLTTRAP